MGKTLGWQIYANDSANNWNFTPIQTFTVETLPSTTLTFKKGWNLISIPNKTILAIVQDPCNIFSKYFYSLNRTTERWESTFGNETRGGKGYWVYSTQDCNAEIILSPEPVTIADIPPLKKGYNLIGTPFFSENLIPIPEGNCAGYLRPALYWNAAEQEWGPQTTLFYKFRGYWIYSEKEECQLG
jgi:hypothetical protein